MATALGQLGSGTFGAFNAQDLAPKKPEPPKDLDQELLESAQAESAQKKEREKLDVASELTKARGEKELAESFAKRYEESPTRQMLEQKTVERADKKFVPTQETVQDLGTLFTLTNLLGFMIGKGGKSNAQAAMSAMNGMLEGHQKGRQDLYKQEKDIYEENIKTLDKTIDSLYKKMQDDIQLYTLDRDKGMAALRTTMAEHRADTLSAMLEKYGPVKPYEVVKQMVAMRDKRKAAEEALTYKEELRQDRLRAEQDRNERAREHDATMRLIASMKQQPQESTLGSVNPQKAYTLGLPLPKALPYEGRNAKENQAILGIELRKAEDVIKLENDRAEKAESTIRDMQQALNVMDRITTGKPGATGMGFYANMNNSDVSLFNSISNSDQRNQYIKGEGALSDKEREQMAKTTFNISNPIETNRIIVEQKLEAAKLNQAKADFISKYVGTYATINGAQEAWTEYMRANPFFDPTSPAGAPLKINKNRNSYQNYFRTQLSNEVPHGR